MTERADAAMQPQDRLDRQPDRLAVDQDRHAGQLAEARRLQREKRPVEDGEGDERRRPVKTVAWRLSVFQKTSA